MDTASRTYRNSLFALVIVLGVFLRSYHLGDKILYCDELFILHGTNITNMQELKEFYKYEPHILVPTMITRAWVATFGNSTAALHSESLLWSILALLIFTYAVSTTLSWQAAIASATVFAFNPFLIEFAQIMRYPSLLVFFATLWFLGLMKLKDGGGAGWLALYATGLALSASAHLYTIYAAAALGLVVLFTRHRWGRFFIPLIAAHFLPLLIVIPKLLVLRQSGVTDLAGSGLAGNPIAHLMTFPVGGMVGIFYSMCCGRFINIKEMPHGELAVILAFFGLLCAASIFSIKQRFEAGICAAVFAISVVTGWLVMIFFSVPFFNHYYVPMTIMFCVLVGMGIERASRTRPFLAPILIVAICLFSLSRLWFYWETVDREPNTKSILEYVTANSRDGDMLNVSPPYFYFLEYYWNGSIPTRRFEPDYILDHSRHNLAFRIHASKHQLTDSDMEQWHRDVASKYARVWMYWILSPSNSEDSNETAQKWLTKHYTKLESHPSRLFTYDTSMPALLELYEVKPVPPEELHGNIVIVQ